jgi:hypothetical protein
VSGLIRCSRTARDPRWCRRRPEAGEVARQAEVTVVSSAMQRHRMGDEPVGDVGDKVGQSCEEHDSWRAECGAITDALASGVPQRVTGEYGAAAEVAGGRGSAAAQEGSQRHEVTRRPRAELSREWGHVRGLSMAAAPQRGRLFAPGPAPADRSEEPPCMPARGNHLAPVRRT